MRTDALGVSRLSSTRGVLPTSERRLSATTALDTAAGHGGEQDHRRATLDRGVEALQHAHVLALDVHVHERGELLVLDELRTQAREPRDQVVEQLAHGVAGCGDLPLAAGLDAKRGWNANGGHAGVGLPLPVGPWQNST